MGYARNKPQLLPDKLRLIREYLNVDRAGIAEKLQFKIARELEIKPHRISDFELGSEPDMLIVLGYARLAKVRMESIIDDDVTVAAFRKRLGKEFKHTKKRIKAWP